LQHQAKHLALAHTAKVTAAMAALGNEPERLPVTLPERTREVGSETTATWPLKGRRETLASRAARCTTADKRVAELEAELASGCEQLGILENENHSLRKSLDLIASEYSLLSSRLMESDAAVDEALSQFEQMMTSLTVAEADRTEQAIALEAANKKRQDEAETLNARLEAMSARAVAAEKLIAEVRQDLHADIVQSSAELADAIAARHAADKKCEVLQNSLQLKERRVRELEQSHAKLVDDTNKLLKTCKSRDAALACAEERISLLADLFAQLEAEAKRPGSLKEIEKINSQLQSERVTPIVIESVHKKSRTNGGVLKRELDKDAWLFGGASVFSREAN
jgi:chromosome segregation ATPase